MQVRMINALKNTNVDNTLFKYCFILISPKVNLLDDGTLEIQDAFHTIVANVKGPKGDVGEKGGMGEKGADGLTFTPSISEDGVLSWTNSGDVLNPQPISIKGPKGDQGETGAQGPQGEKGEKGE